MANLALFNNRLHILKDILNYFLDNELEYTQLINLLESNQDIYPFLKSKCVMYPEEFNQTSLLNFKGTINDLAWALENYQRLVTKKNNLIQLLSNYANDFLGSTLNKNTLELTMEDPTYNLRNNGFIDFTLFLANLDLKSNRHK